MRTTAIILATLAYGLWAVWPTYAYDAPKATLLLVGQVALAATGALFLAESRLIGVLFVAAAWAELTAELVNRAWGWYPFVAAVARPVPALVLMTILLSYPRERIGYPRFVAAAWALILIGNAADNLTWDPDPPGQPAAPFAWVTVFSSGAEQRPGYGLYWLSVIAVVLAALALVVHRALRSRGLERRELAPVFLASAVYGFALISTSVWMVMPWITGAGDPMERAHVPDVVSISQVAAPLLIPLAFLAAAVSRGLDRARVADLVTGLARPATLESVRQALRDALADPDLDLVLGEAPQRSNRLVLPVTGRAHVLTAPELRRRDDVVRAALEAAALALDHARLHADLQEQVRQVAESRARIVEAGVAERRRVERDLHDGAQQRLLTLAATLGRLQATSDDPAVRELVDEARSGLRAALSELRDLARGIHPAVLEQIGLAAAVRGVAEALPVETEIDIPPVSVSPAVETTAYFVICEALTNAIKHARARRITIALAAHENVITVTVADDGTGGAVLAPRGGLAGLQDRVAALGGSLTVQSPADGGTLLRADLPAAPSEPAGSP
ncbi:sensor histidine kinase [Nonomuraea soli]|uniref:histidine kinase n=1 Tax=Nonomuraea soli TaxID=1032476 RepID=A0A7W0CEH6_9ACTN|nr:sensor histidine kinase [Nonomuraea soli]MBA2889677.1 signal transduction histidine kinase [Nonomuraea soli]